MPRSLFGRTVLLLGGFLLASQAAAFVVNFFDRGSSLYRLNAERLKPIHDWVKTYERFWEESLDRLGEYSLVRCLSSVRISLRVYAIHCHQRNAPPERNAWKMSASAPACQGWR